MNARRPARNAATATSLAALSTAGQAAAGGQRPIGQPQAGEALWSGGSKSSGRSRVEVERRQRRRPAAPGTSRAYWIGRRMSATPSWAMIEPSTNSTIECTIDLRVDHDVDAGRPETPNSQCASITSSPLFISVAESMVILRPIRQVGMAQRVLRAPTSPASAGECPRNGPPEAVRISRRTSRRCRPCRHW